MVHNMDAKAEVWKRGEGFSDWEAIAVKSMEMGPSWRNVVMQKD